MLEFLMFFVLIAILGFIVGVGVLIHKETAWYRDLMQNHPVIGWTASFLAASITWFVASYVIFYAVLFVLMLVLGRGDSIPIQ
jgi:cytochrome b